MLILDPSSKVSPRSRQQARNEVRKPHGSFRGAFSHCCRDRTEQVRTPQGERREARSWKLNEITSSNSATKNVRVEGGVISNAIHRCLGAVLAFFKAERCPRINPSEIWELREIAARARAGFEALSSLENWPKIGTPFPSSGDDTAWEMELDPISPDFWVPFPRTRFSIGLPPLWLRLIEARHGVEERKGERTGATPPFLGCLRVRTHSSFPIRVYGHVAPPVGVAPLSFIPAGRLGLGPDNRKRSQMKSPHIASVVGRRKPGDRAGGGVSVVVNVA